jgi:hypothetical protein
MPFERVIVDFAETLGKGERAEERQRQRFSELLEQALPDPRLRAIMSLRSDFLGHLQNDTPLFKVGAVRALVYDLFAPSAVARARVWPESRGGAGSPEPRLLC